jgi:hypothetical protein
MRGPLAACLLALLTVSGCVPASRSGPAAACLSPIAPRSLEPITAGLGAPSSVLVTADDRLWFTDAKGGTVGRLNPDGSVTVWARGLHNPEAMVELGDGSILVAERDSGDILHVIPGLGTFLFRAADHSAGGISGMVKAPGDAVFVAVPGKVVQVSRGREEVVLHGLSERPRLALEPSGSILVNDRNIGLQRLDRNGILGIIAAVPPIRTLTVDHHGWLIFVSESGELWRWMGRTGTRLLSGLPEDAMVAVDQADNIVVVEPRQNRVLRLVTSFVIQPTRRVRAGFGKPVTLCLPIERASEYKEPVSVAVAAAPPGMSAVVQRQPSGNEGVTLSLRSDLTERLKQGAIVLNVESGTLKQRFFVTLDFGG